MMEEQKRRMEQLVEELNRASDAYYNGRQELMTDYEWDARFDELKRLEEATGTILPDSPTNRVSEDNVEGQKEAHEYPALSLAKTKQVSELAKWAEGRPIWMSWKLDGLTLVVTYDNGRLTKVVTRGNGHIGTNITHLARAINGLPPTIPAKEHTVIRGEAVISYDDFESFLIESGDDYANPRNLASGSLTLKDIEEVKRRNIRWIPFTLLTPQVDVSKGTGLEWLKKQGLTPVDNELISNPTTEQIEQVIAHWQPEHCPYPVDGLVISYDDTEYAQTGSITGHHATRAGLAFKWQDEAVATELEEIEWSCAASTISPVAIFRPVELEGTTVKRASLCNISECERLGIGGKGTRLQVIKANKIIPKIIKVDETVGVFAIPTLCPVCHHKTEIITSVNSGTQTLHCTNSSCPAKQLKKFARFVSKEGMNIDGISEQTISKFINLGWISQFDDLYHLNRHIRELALMEGFGERSATNIMRSIEKSRMVDAQHLLIALSIPKCGSDVSKRLLGHYTIEELMDACQTETDADTVFSHIDGIGPERSALIVGWFKDEQNMNMFRRLMQEVTISQPQGSPTGDLCKGLTFVITGDVHHYKNRNELKAYIESQGGKVAGSVSHATSFLINNDVTSTSGKNQKAQQLGIPIISEDDFMIRFASEAKPQSQPVEGSLF